MSYRLPISASTLTHPSVLSSVLASTYGRISPSVSTSLLLFYSILRRPYFDKCGHRSLGLNSNQFVTKWLILLLVACQPLCRLVPRPPHPRDQCQDLDIATTCASKKESAGASFGASDYTSTTLSPRVSASSFVIVTTSVSTSALASALPSASPSAPVTASANVSASVSTSESAFASTSVLLSV